MLLVGVFETKHLSDGLGPFLHIVRKSQHPCASAALKRRIQSSSSALAPDSNS